MSTGGYDRRVVDGRFELVERLGGGGMGVVWRARDLALHRDVAVKEVRPPDPALAAHDPEGARVLRERVLREARALARVHHPNVVTIHHIVDGGEGTYPWLVMELVTGGSLQDRLEQGPLAPVEAARLGRELLSALRAAHAVGIEHRDVKPANVLLRPDGRPVLTDFGIAAVHEFTGLTATGAVIGSPDFMAPERVSGKEGGPAADLWSLAMLLYVAVEGHHPLRRASTLATLAAVLGEDVPAPRRAGPLTDVLTALLVRDPHSRPDADRVDRMLTTAAEAGTPRPGAPVAPPAPAPGATSYPLAPPAPGPFPTGPAPAAPYPLAPSHPGAPWAGGRTVSPPVRPARSRRGRVAAGSAGVVGVVLAGVLGYTLLPGLGGRDDRAAGTDSSSPGAAGPTASHGTEAAATPGAAKADATDDDDGDVHLLTAGGLRTTMAKLTDAMGGGKVTGLIVYDEYALADAPVKGRPKLYDRYTYRGGDVAVKDGPGGTVMDGDIPVDLAAFDWNAVAALLAGAGRTLHVPQPVNRYLLVDPGSTVFGSDPTVNVYLSDDYGSAYLKADVHGKVIETHPREDGGG
ncbi:serine/threonine-protein kinase [Streptomyces sp. NPDC006334]|uniref:serine/threonine-protein kinase n=1 Tax=Streptomyces sp. NPDC006334 TaxID=3156754 RepID=UPI0033B5DAE1